MKDKFKLPLKLFGDRILFIVITWIFSVTLSVFLELITTGAHIGIYYSIITSLPYTMLIYYEAYDAGGRESGQNKASLKSAAKRLLIWQAPSILLIMFYIIGAAGAFSPDALGKIIGGIYFAPYMGPRGISSSVGANISQFIVFMLIEVGAYAIAYILGMNDIVLIKRKKQKSDGVMKK